MLRNLAVIVLLASGALAEQPAPVLSGTWTATGSPKRVLRGTWSAQILPAAPNTARGSWTLVRDANKIVLEGTWSASKSPRAWQGTWSAQIATGRSRSGQATFGQPLSGTWQAALKDSETATLAEMLRRTLETEITGSWRSRGLSGNWWLKGLRR